MLFERSINKKMTIFIQKKQETLDDIKVAGCSVAVIILENIKWEIPRGY